MKSISNAYFYHFLGCAQPARNNCTTVNSYVNNITIVIGHVIIHYILAETPPPEDAIEDFRIGRLDCRLVSGGPWCFKAPQQPIYSVPWPQNRVTSLVLLELLYNIPAVNDCKTAYGCYFPAINVACTDKISTGASVLLKNMCTRTVVINAVYRIYTGENANNLSNIKHTLFFTIWKRNYNHIVFIQYYAT